jgi:hypothetical protein
MLKGQTENILSHMKKCLHYSNDNQKILEFYGEHKSVLKFKGRNFHNVPVLLRNKKKSA